MVMEASPTPSLEVPEPELLFEFLVVPLDSPAQFRERDEAVEGDVFRKGRKPELRGLLLLTWPFDQEPFLVPGNALTAGCRPRAKPGSGRVRSRASS